MIHKLAENKWLIDYYPAGGKGKRVRIVHWGTEGDAQLYETEVRRTSAHTPSPTNPKIMDVLPEFLEWLKDNRAPRTYQDMKNSLKYLKPIFGFMQVNRITPQTIDQFKRSRSGKLRSQVKELNYLKSLIKWMVSRGYANPLSFKMEMPKVHSKIPQIPHPSDIEAFIAQVKDPLKKTLVLLMWQAGLRFNDAVNLRWENIDFNAQTAIVTQKGGQYRLVALTEQIKSLLEPYKAISGYVFGNPKTGKPWKSVKTLFKGASARAGVKRLRPHLLRHAFGAYCLEATGDIRLLQVLLGHKQISTTQIYSQIAAQRQREGINKTSDYIKNLTEKK